MEGSTAITEGIRVDVLPFFREDLSEPQGPWVFQYQVRVTNQSDAPVRLVARHWRITHGDGSVEDVRGAGVVGEQPRIEPGASFTYASGCPLRTSLGAMEGTYLMVREDGSEFRAKIEAFTLAVPGTLN